VTTTEVSSLDDIWRFTKTDNRLSFCYRGQSDATWDLVPSIFRPLANRRGAGEIPNLRLVARCERDIYREFTLRGRPLSNIDNPWELICLGQHYGVPTRLLDWTKNVLTAVFFAVADERPTDAAVWCLNLDRYPFPARLGRRQPGGGYRIPALHEYLEGAVPSLFQTITVPSAGRCHTEKLDTFLVIEPPAIDRRIEQQEGLLTMHLNIEDDGLEWNHSDYLSRIEPSDKGALITKLVLPQRAKVYIREELEEKTRLNVYRLFPDLTGLGRWLSEVNNVNFTKLFRANN
jgi:hypothetical protein